VSIEQPTVNKITVFVMAAVAALIAVVFASTIDAAAFQVGLIAFAVATGVYAHRALAVSANADREGITVTNLRRTTHHAWSTVDQLSVGPLPKGSGVGMTVELRDGTTVPVEASWAPWYEGSRSTSNTARCNALVAAIDAMRTAPASEDVATRAADDPLTIRPLTADDAEEAARMLSAAWDETYMESFSRSNDYGRDVDEDAAMLTELVSGSITMAGCLVADRSGSLVGISVFGPPSTRDPGLDGFVEVYLLFVLNTEQSERTGTRLAVGTASTLRQAGARGVVAHVPLRLRDLRNRIEALGIAPTGEPEEQIWYGLPVPVVEYRRPLPTVPAPDTAAGPPTRRRRWDGPSMRVRDRGRLRVTKGFRRTDPKDRRLASRSS
jgi:hypothetical protein